VLTGGRRLEGAYRFCSLTIKGLERRLDGIFEPDMNAGARWAVILLPTGKRRAGGVTAGRRPGTMPGPSAREGKPAGGATFRERARTPTTAPGADDYRPWPWIPASCRNDGKGVGSMTKAAVFAPLVIQDDAELRAHAPQLWQTVQTAPLPPGARDALAQVLEFWFFERFFGLTANAQEAMQLWLAARVARPIRPAAVPPARRRVA